MHTRKLILTTAFAAFSLMACSQKAADPPASGEHAAAAEHAGEAAHAADEHAHGAGAAPAADPGHAAEAEHHAEGAATLTLDGDQKWLMDDHTRKAFDEIEGLLKAGPATDDLAGHNALGARLDEALQGLIRGCTMQGPAHDQLHVWLGGFMPAVGRLAKGTDLVALRKEHIGLGGMMAQARAHFR